MKVLLIALIVTTLVSGCKTLQPGKSVAEIRAEIEQQELERHQKAVKDREAQLEAFKTMSVEDFAKGIKVKDDEFEPVVEIDTYRSFIPKRPFGTKFQSDTLLRAFIDKATGETLIDVYVALYHQSSNWRHPRQANYGQPLQTKSMSRIISDVNCRDSGCWYTEHYSFLVEKAELEKVRSLTDQEREEKRWKFKVKTKSGGDIFEMLHPNEIIAFLDFIESYQPIAMR